MVEAAKRVRWQLTVMVFEGEMVTPVHVLQELHSCLTLSHITIHTPGEAKVGSRTGCIAAPSAHNMVKSKLSSSITS